jgi:alkylation response protein AidB-like acyl-CoA dehydrogenase
MKALVGSWENRPYRLLAEVTALRSRVAELEAELEAARADNAVLRQAVRDSDSRAAVLTPS